MSLWEYKILSSKQTPFGHPGLLESFLNALGKDQWEIISWRTAPDNPLEFEALAKRPGFKEWYLEGPLPAPPPQQREPARKKDENLREIVLPEDAAGEEDESIWDDEDEEMPENIFAAIRPFLKRNPQGNGMSASLEILAEKFGVDERDMLRAFDEEGLPGLTPGAQRTENAEHDGWLFWLNRNQRGQTWVNARPKPREQPAQERPQREAPPAEAEAQREPAPQAEAAQASGDESASPAAEAPAAEGSAPEGSQRPERSILDRIRPMMRRNKRGHGFSGSIDYLARALRTEAPALIEQIEALGVKLPATPDERLDAFAIGRFEWYFNRASNGQIWINGREKRDRPAQPPPAAPVAGDAAAATEGTAPEAGAIPVEAPVGETSGAPTAEASVEPTAPNVVATEASPAVEGPAAETPAPEVVAAPAVPTEPAAEVPPSAEAADSADDDGAEDGAIVAATAPSEDLVWLASLRDHLAKARRGTGLSGELGALSDALQTPRLPLLERLVRVGLSMPDSADDKPVYVEYDGLLYWLSRNAEDDLLLNSKDKPKRTTRGRRSPRK